MHAINIQTLEVECVKVIILPIFCMKSKYAPILNGVLMPFIKA